MIKVKLEDVASAAGVSPTTVSRVMNNRGYISEKTRKKVNDAIEELGYFPNEVARSLFINKTNLVGLLFPNVSNPFYGAVVTELEKLLSRQGYKVLICNTDNDPVKEGEHLKMLLANQVDGIIVGSRNKPSELYEKARLAVVSIDRIISDKVPNVRSDNYHGAKLAAEYLAGKDCKHVGLFIGSPPDEIVRGDLRMQGFLDTVATNNVEVSICAVGFDESEDFQRQMIEKYLDEKPDMDGIFATGDTLAGMIKGMAAKKGRDIEVVGYDGTKMFLNLCPDVSTIAQPIEDMAKVAVDILVMMLGGEYDDVEKEYTLPVNFVGKR